MALILNIETATKNCSVSISKDREILGLKEINDGNYTHGENLHVFIRELTKMTGLDLKDLDAVAVSNGPGSFTGLRIGVAAAKGLSFALEIPLISISTLTSLAHAIRVEKGSYIVPMLDARRMEVYAAVYDDNYQIVRPIEAEIIEENSFSGFLNRGKVHFIGDGAEKCKALITDKNGQFHENFYPSSKEMAGLAFAKFEKNDFEDLAYFEPFYLKDFLVTPSKKRS